jgi:hypothetical protein
VIDIRVRSRISKEELEEKKGKILTDDDYNVLVTGPTRVFSPEGQLLAVYRPGGLPKELLAEKYDTLHSLKSLQTNNRGLASGSVRVAREGSKRSSAKPVASAIIGSYDAKMPKMYCRLTAWTGAELEKWEDLLPLFQVIGTHFKEQVPDRYAVQMAKVMETKPEWVVPGTPFTTITVNNTYPTGVHTDSGDLEEGFSNLSCLRRGDYSGGIFVFPEYRVGFDMQDGDVLLMDAHQWHGNTRMELHSDDAERISIVCYYRTDMAKCGTAAEEADRAAVFAEKRALAAVGE